MSGPRITKVEMKRRVAIVYRMLAQGLHGDEVIRLCREKHGWDVCDRQIKRYITEAYQQFAAEAEINKKALFGMFFSRLETQYAKADARKDHRAAADIVEKAAKLTGVAAPQKAEITLANIPLSELEAELARLEAKIAADGDAANDG